MVSKHIQRRYALTLHVFRKPAEHLFLYIMRIITFTHVRHLFCAKIESARPARTGPPPGTAIDQPLSL
jgi:hypothetical protein